MITAVDTSVLLDVFLADGRHGERSKTWLRAAYDAGAIVVCDIVYAELVPAFADRNALEEASGHVEKASNSFLPDSRLSLLHSGHLETIRSDAHAPARMADRAVLIRLTWFRAVI